jgi:FkbM family methyltransferase
MNRILEKVIYRLKGFYPVKIGEQTFKVDPSHLFFWRIVNDGSFEPAFFNMLDQYLSKDSVYCDIGAWVGPTTIYAARLCKNVYAFEPDPFAWKFLLKNIKVNRIENVIPYPFAISDIDGELKMASHGIKPGDSMTSMVNISRYKNFIRAKSIKWDTFIANYKPGKIDFIKMDIEGGEVVVIPTMYEYLEEHKPLLHLSLHPAYLSEDEREEKIRNIFHKLSFYSKVRDERMEVVDIEKYLNIIHESPDFRSFLFLP